MDIQEMQQSDTRTFPALVAVIGERRRQVSLEGWTADHDRSYTKYELARAAACYADPANVFKSTSRHDPCNAPPDGWPFSSDWWKPGTLEENLTKAGALILAQLECLKEGERR